jgi:hypothetical protein
MESTTHYRTIFVVGVEACHFSNRKPVFYLTPSLVNMRIFIRNKIRPKFGWCKECVTVDHDSFSLDRWDCHISNACDSFLTYPVRIPAWDYPQVFLLSNTSIQMLGYYLEISHDCNSSYPSSSFTSRTACLVCRYITVTSDTGPQNNRKAQPQKHTIRPLLASLLSIQELPNWSVGPETCYPHWALHCFPQAIQENGILN